MWSIRPRRSGVDRWLLDQSLVGSYEETRSSHIRSIDDVCGCENIVTRSVSDERSSADASVFMDRDADGVVRNPFERRQPRVFVDRGIVHPSSLATMA